MRTLSLILILALAPTLLSSGTAEDEIVVEFEPGGTPLGDFLKWIELELEQQILFTQEQVEGIRLQSVGAARVKRADLRKYVEATLFARNHVLVERGDALQLVGLDRMIGGAKPGALKGQARVVPPEQLPEWEGRYVVITTALQLEYVNVFEVANMMQTYFTDPMVESVRAVTNPDGLVMTGFPHTVLRAAALIRLLEEAGEKQMKAGRVNRQLPEGLLQDITEMIRKRLEPQGSDVPETFRVTLYPHERLDLLEGRLAELQQEVAELRKN